MTGAFSSKKRFGCYTARMTHGTPSTIPRLFKGRPASRKLFGVVKKALADIGPTRLRVTKTQAAFGAKTLFAFVWLPQQWSKKRPEHCIALTIDLARRIRHKKIAESVESRPGRWTHHLIIEKPSDVDVTVRRWLKESYRFGTIDRRTKKP